MISTTEHLVEKLGARMGYTQSDEISLVLYSEDYSREIYFGGKLQKIVSVSASMTTAFFNHRAATLFPEKPLALFDSRAWVVPTLEEAANALLWREVDATKNSISMAARAHYPHKALHQKSGASMIEMLGEVGVNWDDYPTFFKRGTFVQRRPVMRKFTAEELERLPKQHQARTQPDLMLMRHEITRLEMPPFARVKNRADVIFRGENSQVEEG
jgi:tRNA(His) 5'-end guanylyltransferase